MHITDDIVARANADLQRAQKEAEISRMRLMRAETEIADLQAFLRTLERYSFPVSTQARDSGLSEHTENTTGKSIARAGTTARLLVDACIEAIRKNGAPIKIGELLDIVLTKGFTVGGRDQKSNLAGSLSRDPRLISRGRTVGWDLIQDEEAASVPTSDETASSINEGGTDERSALTYPDGDDPLFP